MRKAKQTYNPCDDCQYSYSKNGQESGMCKICEYTYFRDCKQIEGELIYEVNHYWDDYGDLKVYVIAHCANCGAPYRENRSVDWEYIQRPENLDYHADWNIDVEPIKKMVLERAKTIKLTQNYCHNCGVKIKGDVE